MKGGEHSCSHVRTPAAHLAWVRETYAATFADTGGVPRASTPDEPRNTDGCYINYPDVDLSDQRWNSSEDSLGHALLQGRLPRAAAVKKHWDPHHVFRHRQSIEPVDGTPHALAPILIRRMLCRTEDPGPLRPRRSRPGSATASRAATVPPSDASRRADRRAPRMAEPHRTRAGPHRA
ncbi:BBE domain-containing protein [Streptomyces venezuelae]|uniref:BBE domain-containing protein n=1 Tax=Streptomyces venezuelae TaxID=54571 RepID=UPI0037B52B32